MSNLISREQVVDVTIADMNANVSERLGHDWRRVNAMVADQGSAAAQVAGFDFHFIELYQSGKHHVTFEGDLYQCDRWSGPYLPGQVTYLQPDAQFDMHAEGQATVQQMYFDRSIFGECASAIYKGDPDTVELKGFHGVFNCHIRSLADTLLEEARRPQIGSDLNADLIAQQMAVLILREQNADKIKDCKTRILSPGEASRVISYLEDQIEDIGGMDTVAALIDMDVYSFTRAFRATTGQTPGQFLIKRRVAKVKDLLLGTDDALSDITYATGFSNQPHMTTTFSKHVGISPAKWRKAVRA